MDVWWISRDPKSKATVFADKSAEIKLGAKAIGRRGMKNIEGYKLKERQSPYNRVFDPEKCGLSLKSDHLWQVS
jgi:hypothetical protein